MDDLGFAGTSAFGGVANTPFFDKMCKAGKKMTNFNMTPLCSPSRISLQSGRNHTMCNVGSILESATSFPGDTGEVPNDCALLPEILRLNGYNTGAFGKWHMTTLSELNAGGPTTRWPNQVGYDRFYGFTGGASSQFASVLWDNMNQISVGGDPSFDLGEHFCEKACEWISEASELRPDKPRFMYYATGGVHTPHDLPPVHKAKVKDKLPIFRKGWDVLRQEVIERQKKNGIVPQEFALPENPKEYKAWDDCTANEQELFAVQGATYATYVEKTDEEIGKVVSHAMETDPNTFVIMMYGDNGSSAYGLENGFSNWMKMIENRPIYFVFFHFIENTLH